MRLAVISDIHANLPALEAVLRDIDRREVDMLYCLGDLVGYGPWPNEVVERIDSRRIPTLCGNYDEGVGLASNDCGCAYQTEADRKRGDRSIAYTNEVITEDNRHYLKGLPRHLRLTFRAPRQPEADPLEVLMVHGSPRRINEYLFEDRPDRSFVRMMEKEQADVLLFGHTHKPFHKQLAADSGDEGTRYRHAINTGSVGKPKDGDPRAGYVLLEVDEEPDVSAPGAVEVEFVRVEYEVERAARAVEESPLPDAFADMLRTAH